MGSKRRARLNEQFKREITEILRREVRDPRVGSPTITGVEVTPDLWMARIYVRPGPLAQAEASGEAGGARAGGAGSSTIEEPSAEEPSAEETSTAGSSAPGSSATDGSSATRSSNTKELMEGLEASAPFVRRALGKVLSLRRIPELRFQLDRSMEHAARIEELLREVRPDLQDPGAEPSSDPADDLLGDPEG